MLLEPLPYPDADRLVSVWGRFEPESGFDFEQFALSPPEYAEYGEAGTMLAAFGGWSGTSATLVGEDDEAVRVRGASVTASLFDVLGVAPSLGRVFTEAEDDPGAPDVVVLSHGLWQSAFGGAAGIVGRTIRLNGRATEVIGVMPERFSFPDEDRQFYLPLRIEYRATARHTSSSAWRDCCPTCRSSGRRRSWPG